MSQVIYKYKIPIPEYGFETIINMPAGAEVLSVQVQNDEPMIWALVNQEMPLVPKEFEVIPTGVEIPKHRYDTVSERIHLATLQLHGGKLVFHVFERKLLKG